MHIFSAFGESALDGVSGYLGVTKPTASRSLSSLIAAGYLKKVSSRPLVCRMTGSGLNLLGLE